ncbi:hypothetical protein NQU49_28310, partial [Escherichia coli]|uniref:hypothetical protein n=1 Tax=Escherichia coli TaxID=562 RepID=UPI0021190EAD
MIGSPGANAQSRWASFRVDLRGCAPACALRAPPPLVCLSAGAGRMQSKMVLVVDDNADNRLLYEMILS